jgi:hypothetical protein
MMLEPSGLNAKELWRGGSIAARRPPVGGGARRAKVSVDAIREGMAGRGFLKRIPSGAVSSTDLSDFHRAKIELLKDKLQEGDGLIWRP